MKRQKVAFAIVLALLISQIGCTDTSADSLPLNAPARPSIEFVYPHANDIVSDYPISIETKVSNVTLAPPVQYWGKVQREDDTIGHIHYTLDDSPIFATEATKIKFGSPAIPYHRESISCLSQLVHVNHDNRYPRVYAEVTIRCERPEKKDEQQSSHAIPVDDQVRLQMHGVEQQIQEVQQQIQQYKEQLSAGH